MKILSVPIIFFILLSCGSSKSGLKNDIKIKTFNSSNLKFSYPASWKSFGDIRNIYLQPKEIVETLNAVHAQYLLINKSSIPIND